MPVPDSNDIFNQFLNEYVQHLEFERNASWNTVYSYRRDLKEFVSFLRDAGITDISEIQAPHIAEFLSLLSRERGICARTTARYLSSLRGFFRYQLQSEHLQTNPMKKIDSPKMSKNLPVVMSIQEIEKLFEQPDVSVPLGLRDRLMLEMLYSSGLRVSELINLRLTDISVSEEVLRVLGKGDKERIVPIGSSALKWLDVYLLHARPALNKNSKGGNILILNCRGTRISRMGVWKIVRSYLRAAELPEDIHPHTFRHSFASHMVSAGADLRSVQEMLGHSDISTTQIYTHIENDFIKQEHTDKHPRGKSRD